MEKYSKNLYEESIITYLKSVEPFEAENDSGAFSIKNETGSKSDISFDNYYETGEKKYYFISVLDVDVDINGIHEQLKKKGEEDKLEEDKSSINSVVLVVFCNNYRSKILIEKKIGDISSKIRGLLKKHENTKTLSSIKSISIEIYSFDNTKEHNNIEIAISDRLGYQSDIIKGNKNKGDPIEKISLIEGHIFKAKLSDVCNLLIEYGERLFERNLRYRIKDINDVETSIVETLSKNPSYFWYYNNGITIQTRKGSVDYSNPEKIVIRTKEEERESNEEGESKDDAGTQEDTKANNSENFFSVINGAQTLTSSSKFFILGENDGEKSQEISNIKEEAYVLLRIIESADDEIYNEKSKQIVNDIKNNTTVSLNRQKPIQVEDIAYQTFDVSSYNEVVAKIENPRLYLSIAKRGDEGQTGADKILLEDYSRLAMMLFENKPGNARSAGRSTLLKIHQDDANLIRLVNTIFPDIEEIYNNTEDSELKDRLKIYIPIKVSNELRLKINEIRLKEMSIDFDKVESEFNKFNYSVKFPVGNQEDIDNIKEFRKYATFAVTYILILNALLYIGRSNNGRNISLTNFIGKGKMAKELHKIETEKLPELIEQLKTIINVEDKKLWTLYAILVSYWISNVKGTKPVFDSNNFKTDKNIIILLKKSENDIQLWIKSVIEKNDGKTDK